MADVHVLWGLTSISMPLSVFSEWFGLYKPRTGHTGRCMNHAPAILTAPALIYSTHRLLVVCIVVHFHLYSLLDRYTALEVWTVRRPMRVCCGSRRGRCVLFTSILDSLTVPCLVYNTAMYTVYGRCGQYGRCIVHTLAGAAGAWFIRTRMVHWDIGHWNWLEFSWRVPIENNGQCISMRTPNLITTSIQITFNSYLFWVLVDCNAYP